MLCAVVVALSALGALPATGGWYEHYARGIQLIREGDAHGARSELEQALAERSEEGLRLHAADVQYVDYVPHLYLAIAYHMEGNVARAREHLQAGEDSGVAARSEVGRPLLEAYRILLGGTRPEPRSEPARFSVYPRRPTIMSEGEFERVRSEVLARCQLKPGTEPPAAPWYFHYELGLALARKGDGQRALDALIEAVNRRGDPQRSARLYGVWFTDYLPYFQIARAHYSLGNWDCAADALAVSQRMGEISAKDREFAEMRELAKEIEDRVKP